ncbi:hypothetical protein J6590_080821 [Homalodisca vitripennis]|nr:hypothetical protein J6590_080821 [Homalodisca vitripennis]
MFLVLSIYPRGVLLPTPVEGVAGREVIETVEGIRTRKHFRNLPKGPAVNSLRLVTTNTCTGATSSLKMARSVRTCYHCFF